MYMNKLKEIIIKTDEVREKAEDFIVSNVLAKWDSYEKVDDLRFAANMAVINFAVGYIDAQGIPANQIPQEVKEKIAKAGAKVEKKLNALLQKQLQKKSKMYKDRHNVN